MKKILKQIGYYLVMFLCVALMAKIKMTAFEILILGVVVYALFEFITFRFEAVHELKMLRIMYERLNFEDDDDFDECEDDDDINS